MANLLNLALEEEQGTAQLLAQVIATQNRQQHQAKQLRDRLRGMRAHQQTQYTQEGVAYNQQARAPVSLVRDRLQWMAKLRVGLEGNIANDAVFAYGPLQRLCYLALQELDHEEGEGEEEATNDNPGVVHVHNNRHNSHQSNHPPLGAGRIRPTGRAIRRRIPYTISSQPRQNNFFDMALDLPEHDFRIVFRMSKRTFWSLVDLIRPNEVFADHGGRKQRPVFHQLGAFLIRFGSMGSRGDFTALLTSVGKGSVPIYCERVTYAIRIFGLSCVGWPSAERKEEIKLAFRETCGLNGIIGILDGSLIDLAKRPAGSEEAFRSRKGTIATNIQAIVDHEGRFIAYETGFPGSKNDSYIWKQSFVWSHRHAHFSNGEFLLADGGYPLSRFVLTPFARNERQGDDRARKIQFNRQISRARVLVERTFGQLKSRFPSLVMMGEIGDLEMLYHTIEALMVLHNICYDLHDTVSGEADAFIEAGGNYDWVDHESDLDAGPGANINEHVLVEGRAFRARCMDQICPP